MIGTEMENGQGNIKQHKDRLKTNKKKGTRTNIKHIKHMMKLVAMQTYIKHKFEKMQNLQETCKTNT